MTKTILFENLYLLVTMEEGEITRIIQNGRDVTVLFEDKKEAIKELYNQEA